MRMQRQRAREAITPEITDGSDELIAYASSNPRDQL
jgi:hypothetical protein